ncbi:carbohydrate ABC transporter substrate-binding protein (CUT1 family) [Luteococcus japonicus]|uniref:Carbohydrate ABC transporter substrate-binding protein (CUT1 family) n=1 Tax=Luteococcus japonicus TaxID=33984 RepID=A0A3N1ZY01_9ACTN|nr:extracellular solute-binding protein [Luteococcus japonicus]ROR55724.1 carbohydrate ABC transporter substrate-binding protein (CUT1 family) [Luteococcus japonicus]
MSSITRRGLVLGSLGAAGGLALGGCSSGSGGPMQLELFQFKSEAIKLFDKICEQFNAANPGTQVNQNFQADNITALRVRLVKDNFPDLITINGDYGYGSLAKTNVFYDFSKTSLMEAVQPGIGEILPTLGTGGEGQVNGLPFANNGSGVIYNVDVFDKAGVKPPTTWAEFVELCDELTAKKIDPFVWGFKDNWTGAPMFSSISAGHLTDGVAAWYAARAKGEHSFTDLLPVMEKMKKLAGYGNKNRYALGYNDANQAFAKGEAAMYLHGTYAIPAIRSYNKEINLGTFATPAEDAKDTKVVSGVDVALTMGVEPRHEAEQLAFIEHLMKPANLKAYCDEQVAFPTLKGMKATDPALQGLVPYFDRNQVSTYSDHNFPQAVTLNAYMQQFLIDGDAKKFASTLDEQWDKVVSRLQRTQ